MTYTGRIQDPLVNVDNDDPVDPASDKAEADCRQLKKAGTADLFRLLWADQPGHGRPVKSGSRSGIHTAHQQDEYGQMGRYLATGARKLASEIAETEIVGGPGCAVVVRSGPLPGIEYQDAGD